MSNTHAGIGLERKYLDFGSKPGPAEKKVFEFVAYAHRKNLKFPLTNARDIEKLKASLGCELVAVSESLSLPKPGFSTLALSLMFVWLPKEVRVLDPTNVAGRFFMSMSDEDVLDHLIGFDDEIDAAKLFPFYNVDEYGLLSFEGYQCSPTDQSMRHQTCLQNVGVQQLLSMKYARERTGPDRRAKRRKDRHSKE